MSFAIGAIILILILMPGASIIYAYYHSFTNKASRAHVSLTDQLLGGILLSIFIHCIFLCTFQFMGYQIDLNLLYKIINGSAIDTGNRDLTQHCIQFITYTLFLTALFYVLTKRAKHHIQNNLWDLRYHALRSTNYWFDVLSARQLEIPGVPGRTEKVDFIFIDIFTSSNILYSGRVIDFNYSPTKDELENIVIANAIKRRLKPEGTYPDECHLLSTEKKIPGDTLVIKASSILNMNIYYVRFTNEEKEESISDPLTSGA